MVDDMKTRTKVLIGAAIAIALAYMKREEISQAVSDILLGEWKSSPNAQKYLPMLNTAERAVGIPTDLLARVAYQESHFRDDIVNGTNTSAAGAQGIMQLVPKWHPTVDPLNVPAAINYAAKYLKSLFVQFGSWPLALAAYNAGPGNVQKYNGIPPFKETQDYVSQILRDVPVA